MRTSSSKQKNGPHSVQELRRLYERRETSPVEVVGAALAVQEQEQERLNAFVTPMPGPALAAARGAEAAFSRDETPGVFAGVPVAVKDLIDVGGVRATYGSAIFADHTALADAFIVEALNGASVVGKAATHEFAWGITSENPHHGPCRNPWDPERIPGGSSGGSAVAVASGQALIALGSDTAGSVRIPAAYCGVTGFKPTFGLVPLTGVFPLAPSLDNAGVFARNTKDIELVLDAWFMAAGIPAPRAAAPRKRGELRVGVLRVAGTPVAGAAIAARLDAAAAAFEQLGAQVQTVDLDPPFDPVATLGAVQSVEAFDTHASRGLFPARAADYGADVRGRLEAASALTLDDLLPALRARRAIRDAMAGLFTGVDFLLSLVSPCPPPRIGETGGLRDLVLPYTVLQSLGGFPACAFPIGVDELGLPVGGQLTGPWLSDYGLLETVGLLAGLDGSDLAAMGR